MKKYNLCFFLLTLLSACTGEDNSNVKTDYPEYQVKGEILPVSPSARITDSEKVTSFQSGDSILIGWEGNTSTYQYTYSGNDGVFALADENNRSLWSDLIRQSGTIDVYAWYGKSSDGTTLPATVSVDNDQSTEGKYLSNIYLAAHTVCSPTVTSLDLKFSHLMARLRLSIDFNDKEISTSDMLNATVTTLLHTSGTLKPADADKNLQIVDVAAASPVEVTMLTQTVAGSYHLDCICLLPPQTLTAASTVITITLDNGKEYSCTLSKDLTLNAGEEVKIPIEISVGGTSVYDPAITIVPDTRISSYSGNRLITGNIDQTVTIYEQQADGSWGNPAYVYASPDSDQKLDVERPYFASIDICGDYAGAGVSYQNGGSSRSDDKVFLFHKNKTTGKWYMVQKMDNTAAYALTMNERFIIYGNGNANSCYVIPIDKNKGFRTDLRTKFNISTYKLYIADNDIFCNNSKVFQLTSENNKINVTDIVDVNGERCSTDGKKVIRQNASQNIHIYNLKAEEEETIDYPIVAGTGRPVVIYDRYALAGYELTTLVLYYFDNTKWRRLGDRTDNQSFLKILQQYAPSNQIKGLTYLEGNKLMMKGTKISIVSNDITYFVENIDQIVSRYLQEHPLN